MLLDILKDVLNGPERPYPYEPRDDEIYMMSKPIKNNYFNKRAHHRGQ